VDLIDEHDGAVADAPEFLGVRHDGLDFLDPAQYGAEGNELAFGEPRDQRASVVLPTPGGPRE